ncbi:MAG: helix-hairpin-helix domain-containing protein [Armatimonadota bacterium]
MDARSSNRSAPDAGVLLELQKIPNVGPAIADDLLRLGIRSLEELAVQDPDDMYRRLCDLDGKRHDPCVRDVFAAVTDFARGGEAKPWWEYSRLRKSAELI